jgi:hypothetical protein
MKLFAATEFNKNILRQAAASVFESSAKFQGQTPLPVLKVLLMAS